MPPSYANQDRVTRRAAGLSLLCAGFATLTALSAILAPADNSPAGIAALLLPFVGACVALFAVVAILRALSTWKASSNVARVLVLSGPALLVLVLGPSFFCYAQRGKAPLNDMAVCAGNMRAVTDALISYAASSGGRYPASADWARIVEKSAITTDLVCPARPDLPSGYVLNSSLPGVVVRTVRIPESVVLLFESDADSNAAGGPELLPDVPRHLGGDNYGFADGSVKCLPRKKLPDGTWAKEPDADWVIWGPGLKESEAEPPPASDP